MSPIGVSNVLGWHPAGSVETSTHWPAVSGRPAIPIAAAIAIAAMIAMTCAFTVRDLLEVMMNVCDSRSEYCLALE
jgi:hypothetical protein